MTPDPTTLDPAAALRACIELAAKATPDWRLQRHGVIVGGVFHEYTHGAAQSQIAMFTAPRDDVGVIDTAQERDDNAAAALACVNWTRDAAPALLAEVEDWRALFCAFMEDGLDQLDPTFKPTPLWPNPWHQDAAFLGMRLHQLREAERKAEAAEQVAREAVGLLRRVYLSLHLLDKPHREWGGVTDRTAIDLNNFLAHHGAGTGESNG